MKNIKTKYIPITILSMFLLLGTSQWLGGQDPLVIDETGNSIFSGDVNIGGTGNAQLKVRAIKGKNAHNENEDHLYLNLDNSNDVYIGGGISTSDLIVSGALSGTSGNFNGNVRATTMSVGIGTSNPTKGKLEVAGSVRYITPEDQEIINAMRWSYVAGAKAIIEIENKSNNRSAYFSGDIFYSNAHVNSDARIKKIRGLSSNPGDLEILKKIEITDYQMKDSIAFGNSSIKKVIAQQVQKVYPQVVSTTANEIPDIYMFASIDNGWVNLSTNVNPGEKVQLIFGSDKQLFDVIEVRENGFRVDTDKTGDVFVYGRQVDDFLSVDYDAISMLNVSATQELAKQLEQVQAENKQQATRITELEKQINDIETLKAAVAQLQSNLSADRQELNGEMTVGSNE